MDLHTLEPAWVGHCKVDSLSTPPVKRSTSPRHHRRSWSQGDSNDDAAKVMCIICYEQIYTWERGVAENILSCDCDFHVHGACLEEWCRMSTQPKCLICRNPIDSMADEQNWRYESPLRPRQSPPSSPPQSQSPPSSPPQSQSPPQSPPPQQHLLLGSGTVVHPRSTALIRTRAHLHTTATNSADDAPVSMFAWFRRCMGR